MSNTSIGPARKGSKMQMQKLTSAKNPHYLNSLLDDTLKWISPCKKLGYSEFQLNNPKLGKRLGIPNGVFKDFWTSRQPQWDGIALGKKTKTLYLFEAKSHKGEFCPRKKGTNENNNRQIESSIQCVANKFIEPSEWEAHSKMWCEKYYQIANRIAFSDKMLELCSDNSKYKNVVLVFLNFVNDTTWGNKMVKTEEEWDCHYKKIFEKMGIKQSLPQLEKSGIRIVNFDLKK